MSAKRKITLLNLDATLQDEAKLTEGYFVKYHSNYACAS